MKLELCCPISRDKLATGENSLSCSSCGMDFPVVGGVPVLLGTKQEIDAVLAEYRSLDMAEVKKITGSYKEKTPQAEITETGIMKTMKFYKRGIREEMLPYLKMKLGLGGGTKRASIDETKKLEVKAYGGLSREFEKSKKSSLRMWDGKLRYMNYEKLRQERAGFLAKRLKEHGIRAKSVLEIGCGNMQNAKFLEQELGAEYHGFDYNLSRVVIGKMLEGNRYDVWCGDGTAIALEDKSVDLGFTMHVMERMGAGLPKMASEIERVSKHFACFEPAYEYQNNMFGRMHIKTFDYPRGLKKILMDAGMEIIEEKKAETGSMFNLPGFILAKCP